MNQGHYLKTISERITSLITAVEDNAEIKVDVTNESIPVTSDGLTDLAAAINNSKIDVNLKSNEVASFPVTGTVAVTNASIDDIKTNTNVLYTSYSQQAEPVANTNAIYTCNLLMNSSAPYAMANPATNSGNKDGYCQRVCVATDDINLKKLSDCVTGTNLNVGTHAVTVSSGTIDATCSGTVAVTNAALTELNNCFDAVNHHVEVDTNAINGVTMSVNSGVNGTGVQRVCVATDDVNLSTISTTLTTISATLSTISSNISSILTSTNTSKGYLLSISQSSANAGDALIDVWDQGTHKLKVDTT